MRPKQQRHSRHGDLFRARLDQIINMKHELVVLADKIDWAWLDARPAVSESRYVRHVRAETPLSVRVDGNRGRGVVLHDD